MAAYAPPGEIERARRLPEWRAARRDEARGGSNTLTFAGTDDGRVGRARATVDAKPSFRLNSRSSGVCRSSLPYSSPVRRTAIDSLVTHDNSFGRLEITKSKKTESESWNCHSGHRHADRTGCDRPAICIKNTRVCIEHLPPDIPHIGDIYRQNYIKLDSAYGNFFYRFF